MIHKSNWIRIFNFKSKQLSHFQLNNADIRKLRNSIEMHHHTRLKKNYKLHEKLKNYKLHEKLKFGGRGGTGGIWEGMVTPSTSSNCSFISMSSSMSMSLFAASDAIFSFKKWKMKKIKKCLFSNTQEFSHNIFITRFK